MTITPFGYFFLATTAFGVALTIGVSRRWTREGKPLGWGGSAFVGLILVIMSTLFFMFSFFGAKAIYEMVTFPKYQATIIGFDSSLEDVRRTDDDGFSYTEQVLMHTPTLRFTDDAGQVITQRGSIRSGAEPVIGDTVMVAYHDGSLQVISLASVGLYTGLAVMLMILGFILAKVSLFALGRRSAVLDGFGSFLLVYIVIGGGMLFMFAGMVYGVYSYFQPGSDVPLWAALVCAFFALTLGLAFIGMFLQRKKAK